MKRTATWCAGLLVLAGVLLSGCDLQVQSKGQISVTTDPERAEVLINGKSFGQAPAVAKGLLGGDYLVELRKDGYSKLYKSISLLDGQQLELQLKMEPLGGLLLVESNPPGADVFIGGVSKGRTPLLLHDLPVGSYKLEFKSENELPCTIETKIRGRLPQRAFVELTSNTFRLTVQSTPEGAEVRVNGVKVGETPVVIKEVKAGQTDIRIDKQGYKPFITSMLREATKPYEINEKLEALPSELTVISEPAGAKITIDKKPVGVAPLTLKSIESGVHEVEAELAGFELRKKTIFLEPDTNDMVEFNMKKDSGVLVLHTEPAYVQVFINGESFTTTMPKDGSDTISQPVKITLKSDREHTLQLVREGFTHLNTTVRVEIDKVVTRHEVLKRIFVYDTKITTGSEVIKCRIEYKLPNGDIYYERFAGAFNTVKAADIREVAPITLDDESNREAKRLIEQNRRAVPQP